LSGKALWAEIRRLAAGTAGVRMVAVAYVGPNSVDSLNLRKGDALHCALSLRNARAGIVCPSELIKLRRRKVRLYADEHLHAKIYLLGRAVIVGSANVSRRSAALDEAALCTRDRSAVESVRAWFEARQDEEVSDEFLKKCDAVYRPPIWNPFADGDTSRKSPPMPVRRGAAHTARRPRQDAERWWLLWNARDYEFSDEEQAMATEAESDARRRVVKSRWRALEPIIWVGRNAVVQEVRVGDKVVCTVPAGRGQALTPWGTCQGVRRRTPATGSPRVLMSVEFPLSDTRLPYKTFVTRARAAGLPISLRGGSRFYVHPNHVRTLRSLTSARALRRRH
jgi:hypothetical protein